MSIFTERCVKCRQTLPSTRAFRDVCDDCGNAYAKLLNILSESEALLKKRPDAFIAYNQCLIGLSAAWQLEPFLAAGVQGYAEADASRLQRYFAEEAHAHAIAVARRNDGLPYANKVGIAPISHAKTPLDPKPLHARRRGHCGACQKPRPLNNAGYCYECVRRATSYSRQEMDAYARQHSVRGMSELDWQLATLDWKLGRKI
jgi:hypothetical protein